MVRFVTEWSLFLSSRETAVPVDQWQNDGVTIAAKMSKTLRENQKGESI